MIGLGVFRNIVAYAVATGYEDHCGGTVGGKHLRVVSGAGRHFPDLVVKRSCSVSHQLNHAGVKFHRLESGQDSAFKRYSLAVSDFRNKFGHQSLGML